LVRTVNQPRVEREPDSISIEYNFGDLGYWILEFEPERVTIERI